MIQLDQASLRVGSQQILESISLTLTPGQVTAIVGPNGSGKSSLMKLMVGETKPSSGRVTLEERALEKWSRKELARLLAWLPQASERPNGMSVREVVACGRFAHLPPWGRLSAEDELQISNALRQTEMVKQADTLVDHLSGGEMQRVWLATVLAQGAEILLLDEPSSFLDLSHQLELMALIRELNRALNKTVALVIHDLNQALQWCDQVIVIDQGKVRLQGDIALLRDTNILREVFDLEAQFVPVPGSDCTLLHAQKYV